MKHKLAVIPHHPSLSQTSNSSNSRRSFCSYYTLLIHYHPPQWLVLVQLPPPALRLSSLSPTKLNQQPQMASVVQIPLERMGVQRSPRLLAMQLSRWHKIWLMERRKVRLCNPHLHDFLTHGPLTFHRSHFLPEVTNS